MNNLSSGIWCGNSERDRQRERQRQERAQMLPSDDKDITANTQDLFESPPVKVDPIAEDHTTAEIRKQFGNFETVRHYILDNAPYSRRLIGIEQTAAANNPGNGSRSVPRVSGTTSQLAATNPSGTSQSLPHRPPGNSSSSSNIRSAVSGALPRNHVPPLTASSQSVLPDHTPALVPAKNPPGFKSTFVPVPVKPVDSGNSHKSPQVPQQQHHSVQPPLQHNDQSNQNIKVQPKLNNTLKPTNASVGNVINNNNNHHNSGSAQFRSGSSFASSGASAPHPPSSHSRVPFPPPRKPTNSHISHTSSAPIAPNQLIPNNNSNSGVSSTYSSSHRNNSANDITPFNKPVVTPKVEHVASCSTIVKSEEVAASSNNNSNSNSVRPSSEPIRGSRLELGDGVDKKPLLDTDTVDSPAELETILKEMMDVKPLVTGIQTPGPANDITLTSQRRSSKGDDIVQAINDSGIANVPSPVKKMDSSGDSSTSSSGSDSDTDSDDSSSGSQGDDKDDQLTDKPTTNSPTRNWDLSSFLSRNEKDTRAHESILDSTLSPAPVSPLIQVKTEPNVTSTSIYGKPVIPSPKETINTAQGKSPRKAPEVRLDPYVQPKPPLATAPTKGTPPTVVIKTKGASLSESSSEDESSVKPAPKEIVPRVVIPEPKRPVPVNKRQKSLSSSPERKPSGARAVDLKAKGKKGQDRNKNDTLRNVFRIKNAPKVNSPTPVETEKPTKATAGTAGKGKLASPKGKGKPSPKAPPPQTVNNRVSAKDSGKKSTTKTNATLMPSHNGTIDPITSKTSTSTAKRKEAAKKATPQPPPPKIAKTHHKSQTSGSSGNASLVSAMLPPLPPPALRIKEDLKPNLTLQSNSSLICRIPLHKLPKRPRLSGSTSSSSSNLLPTKNEKIEKGSVPNKDDISKSKPHYDSTRVGSSSDHAVEIDIFGLNRGRETTGSGVDKSKKPGKRSKRITSSQKKGKTKPVPVSRIKVEEDSGHTEVSSNVPGYSPPVDAEIVQAPDSSLHPSSHLMSPVVPSQPAYLSYFDKIEHPEDEDILDQDVYLETAKKLKHKADKEECGSFKQVFTYLESGLYFILTGIAIEKDRPSPSKEAHTMYKDTLHLIRYIGNRFRSRPDCYAESKVMVLGLRCQALLSLKLFKMKFKEAKDIAEVLSNHFQKTPPTPLELANSPQLSTPSPRSPTSSPASSLLTGLNPSPHHPYQNHPHLILSQNLHAQMYKHCTHSMNLMNAHEIWEMGDTLVHKSRIEDFFIGIDRVCGPLTLHSSLTDLVRYVKQGIKVLKDNAEIS